MTTGTDLAPTTGEVVGTDLVVTEFPASDALVFALRNGLRLRVPEQEVNEADMVERSVKGTSEDDILGSASSELEDVARLVGKKLKLTRFGGLRNSDYEGGVGVFGVADFTEEGGEIHTIGIGSSDALGKVLRYHEQGLIPSQKFMTFQQATKPTKAGFYPWNLVPWTPSATTKFRSRDGDVRDSATMAPPADATAEEPF